MKIGPKMSVHERHHAYESHHGHLSVRCISASPCNHHPARRLVTGAPPPPWTTFAPPLTADPTDLCDDLGRYPVVVIHAVDVVLVPAAAAALLLLLLCPDCWSRTRRPADQRTGRESSAPTARPGQSHSRALAAGRTGSEVRSESFLEPSLSGGQGQRSGSESFLEPSLPAGQGQRSGQSRSSSPRCRQDRVRGQVRVIPRAPRCRQDRVRGQVRVVPRALSAGRTGSEVRSESFLEPSLPAGQGQRSGPSRSSSPRCLQDRVRGQVRVIPRALAVGRTGSEVRSESFLEPSLPAGQGQRSGQSHSSSPRCRQDRVRGQVRVIPRALAVGRTGSEVRSESFLEPSLPAGQGQRSGQSRSSSPRCRQDRVRGQVRVIPRALAAGRTGSEVRSESFLEPSLPAGQGQRSGQSHSSSPRCRQDRVRGQVRVIPRALAAGRTGSEVRSESFLEPSLPAGQGQRSGQSRSSSPRCRQDRVRGQVRVVPRALAAGRTGSEVRSESFLEPSLPAGQGQRSGQSHSSSPRCRQDRVRGQVRVIPRALAAGRTGSEVRSESFLEPSLSGGQGQRSGQSRSSSPRCREDRVRGQVMSGAVAYSRIR